MSPVDAIERLRVIYHREGFLRYTVGRWLIITIWWVLIYYRVGHDSATRGEAGMAECPDSHYRVGKRLEASTREEDYHDGGSRISAPKRPLQGGQTPQGNQRESVKTGEPDESEWTKMTTTGMGRNSHYRVGKRPKANTREGDYHDREFGPKRPLQGGQAPQVQHKGGLQGLEIGSRV